MATPPFFKNQQERTRLVRTVIFTFFVTFFVSLNIFYFYDLNSAQKCPACDVPKNRRRGSGNRGPMFEFDFRHGERDEGAAAPPPPYVPSPLHDWAMNPPTAPPVDRTLPEGADIFSWLSTRPEQQVRTNMTHRAEKLPLAIALRQFRHSDFDTDIAARNASDIICNLVMMQTRNCDPWRDTLVKCVARFGKENWEKILSDRCKRSSFWEEVLPVLLGISPTTTTTTLLATGTTSPFTTQFATTTTSTELFNTTSTTTLATPATTSATTTTTTVAATTTAVSTTTAAAPSTRSTSKRTQPPRPQRSNSVIRLRSRLNNNFPVMQAEAAAAEALGERRKKHRHNSVEDDDKQLQKRIEEQRRHEQQRKEQQQKQQQADEEEKKKQEQLLQQTQERKAWRRMKRGTIFESQMLKDEDCVAYVPPNERTFAVFPPPRICKSRVPGCKHYPISFGLPRSYFVDKVPRTKSFDWMPILPRPTPSDNRYQARLHDEDLFRELYSQSFFAWTASRAGVDALRHYEIIAAGSVPFFFDIGRAPRHTVGNLPRALLHKTILNMPGIDHIMPHGHDYTMPNMYGGVNFRKQARIDQDKFNISRYYEIADELLEYGKRYLSAPAIVSYMLRVLDVEEPGRGERKGGILFFGRSDFDYLDVTLLTGFGELGIKVTVVMKPKEYLFKLRTKSGTMSRKKRDERYSGWWAHGAGFGYALRIPGDTIGPHPFYERANETIRRQIINKHYDLVIYSLVGGDPAVAYPYYEDVKRGGAKLALLQYRDGHDDVRSSDMWAGCKMGADAIFIREMSDKGC